MTTNPAAAGSSYIPSTGAVRSAEPNPQAGPHIALTSGEMEIYIDRMKQVQTAVLHRFERHPVRPVIASPLSADQIESADTPVRVTTIRDVETAPSAERADSPVKIRPGSLFEAIAFLDPELAELANEAEVQEQAIGSRIG